MNNYKQTPYGKGSARRPVCAHISREEIDLRYALAYGQIDLVEFDKQMTELTGVKYVRGKKQETNT